MNVVKPYAYSPTNDSCWFKNESNLCANSNNHFQGAVNECASRVMVLPDLNTLKSIYQKKTSYPNIIPQTGEYFSSTRSGIRPKDSYDSSGFRARTVNFANGGETLYSTGDSPGVNMDVNLPLMCVLKQ